MRRAPHSSTPSSSRELGQRSHVPERHDHQVAAGVGVGVEDGEGEPDPARAPRCRPTAARWRRSGRRRTGPGRRGGDQRTRARPVRHPPRDRGAPDLVGGGTEATYSLRQPAHRCSRLMPGRRRPPLQPPRGPLPAISRSSVSRKAASATPRSGRSAAPAVDPHRPGRHVVVTHHQDVGDLGHLGPPDPRPERLVGRIHRSTRRPARPQPVGHLVRHSASWSSLHAEDPHLLGRQPGGQGAGVVLQQDGEEPLHRAEQGTVDHDRPMPGVVGTRRTRCRSAGGAGSPAGWWTSGGSGRWRPWPARRSSGRRRRRRPRPSPARGPSCRRWSAGPRWRPSHSSSVPTAFPSGRVDSSR